MGFLAFFSLRSQPKQLTPEQFNKSVKLSHKLASASQDGAKKALGGVDGPLQWRFHKDGFHAVPFKNTEKRRAEHDQVVAQITKLLGQGQGPEGLGEEAKTYHAIVSLSEKGFTRQQLEQALTKIPSVQFAALSAPQSKAVVQQAHKLRSEGAPPASENLPDSDTKADEFAQKTFDRLTGYFADYQSSCLPAASDKGRTKKLKTKLKHDVRKAFKQHPLTQTLKLSPETLHQKVLVEPNERIEALSKRLETLSQPMQPSATEEQQKQHAKKILQCAQELQQAIAGWSELLAVVGRVLSDLAFAEPRSMQEPLIQLGAGLIAQGQVVQLRDGYYMHEFRSAAGVQQQAQYLLDRLAARDIASQAIRWARTQWNRAADPAASQVPSDASHEALEKSYAKLEEEADEAGKQFAGLFDSTSQHALAGVDSQWLAQDIDAALGDIPVLKGLNLGNDLTRVLFDNFPGVLRGAIDRAEQATQDANADQGQGQGDPQLQQLAAQRNLELMRALCRYKEVLATVGDALLNVLDSSQWPPEEQRRVRALGLALVNWAHAMGRSRDLSHMQFVLARQRYQKALQAKASLPSPTVVPSQVADASSQSTQPKVPQLQNRSARQSASTGSGSHQLIPSELETLGDSQVDNQVDNQVADQAESESEVDSSLSEPAVPPRTPPEQPIVPVPVPVQIPVQDATQDPVKDPLQGAPKLPLRSRRLQRSAARTGSQPGTPRRNMPSFSLPKEPSELRTRSERDAHPPARPGKGVRFATKPEWVPADLASKRPSEPRIPPPQRRPEDALGEFVAKAFNPQGGADALDADQQAVQAWVDRELLSRFPDSRIEAKQMASHMDVLLVQIGQRQDALRKMQSEGASDMDVTMHTQDLLMAMDAYVTKYSELVRLLDAGSQSLDLPPSGRAAMAQAVAAMRKHLKAIDMSTGDFQKARSWASKLQGQALERLAPKPSEFSPSKPSAKEPTQPLSPRSESHAQLDRKLDEMQASQPTSTVVQEGMTEIGVSQATRTAAKKVKNGSAPVKDEFQGLFDEIQASLTK